MRPLIIALVLLAADDRYGLGQDQLSTAAQASIEYDGLQLPTITAELKALTPAARAQAVTSLGKVVRAYVESPAFKQQYADYVKGHRPPQPTPMRSADVILAEKKKEGEAMVASVKQQLATLPADQRKQIEESMQASMKATLDMYKDKKLLMSMEEQRFNQEKEAYDKATVEYPDDYRVKLRFRLTTFLTQTDGVDFSAKTVKSDYTMRFANETYEQKPTDWKRAFRAGKPATDAARAFAKDWLAALGT